MTSLKTVNISSTTVKTLNLTAISDLKNLSWIDLSNSTVEILEIRNLSNLQNVFLQSTTFKKVLINHLESVAAPDENLPNLRNIPLNGPLVENLVFRNLGSMYTWDLSDLALKNLNLTAGQVGAYSIDATLVETAGTLYMLQACMQGSCL